MPKRMPTDVPASFARGASLGTLRRSLKQRAITLARRFGVLIPGEVARESGMMSPANPI